MKILDLIPDWAKFWLWIDLRNDHPALTPRTDVALAEFPPVTDDDKTLIFQDEIVGVSEGVDDQGRWFRTTHYGSGKKITVYPHERYDMEGMPKPAIRKRIAEPTEQEVAEAAARRAAFLDDQERAKQAQRDLRTVDRALYNRFVEDQVPDKRKAMHAAAAERKKLREADRDRQNLNAPARPSRTPSESAAEKARDRKNMLDAGVSKLWPGPPK